MAEEMRALAASTSFEAGRARAVRELNVPRGVRQALGDGGDVTYMVGHPIVVCPAEVAAVCKGAHREAQSTAAAKRSSSSTAEAAGSGRAHVDEDGDVVG